MAQLSERLQRLAPSATLAMSQKSAEMKAQGIDVINLSVGEPDFNTPDHIKEAAKKAVDDNYSRYSPVPGYPNLRQAIVNKLKRENALDYSTAEILVSNGAKQSVCNTIMALINKGDEVIIPAPYWVSYPQMVKLAGGEPVIVEAGFEQNFKMTAQQLEAAITPKTRLIILCSPSNPTGSVYSKEELKHLADVILSHENLFVLADEIYEHINYVGKHESIAQFEGMKERSIIVNGVSKAYAMTGWRIGYIAAPEWIVKGCNKLQGQYTSGPCSVSQMAALAAYETDQRCVEEMRQALSAAETSSSNWPRRLTAWRLTSHMAPSISSLSAATSSARPTATPQSTHPPTWHSICWRKPTWPPLAAMPSATHSVSV